MVKEEKLKDGVEQIADGLFEEVILPDRVGLSNEAVVNRMPDFGYLLWSRDGKALSEAEVKKKIDGGAICVTALSGLDTDPTEFREIVKKLFNEYKGEKELLVMGMAVPGFWKQQYGPEEKLRIGDVSSYKYALMVLEWAKRLHLNKHNNLILGHSAGGEAAVLLSKWFRVLAMAPSVHLKDDPRFMFLRMGNAVAKSASGKVGVVDRIVELGQDKIIAKYSGSASGTPLHIMHMLRLVDCGGQSNEMKVIELCKDDGTPDFEPNIDDLSIVTGGKDILTPRDVARDWFEEWFGNKKWEQRGTAWEKMTNWFDEKIMARMKHDTLLVDSDSQNLIVGKAIDLLDGINELAFNEALPEELELLRQKIASLDESIPDAQEELNRFLKLHNEFTMKAHSEMGMEEYLEEEVYEKIKKYLDGFLDGLNKPKDDSEFMEWNERDGKKLRMDLIVELLKRAVHVGGENDGKSVFSESELKLIAEGKLGLKDEKIRARIVAFPYWCEGGGWVAKDEYRTTEFRSRASRGYLLDTVIYNLADLLLRRIEGFDVTEETSAEQMVAPLQSRLVNSSHTSQEYVPSILLTLKNWYQDWILNTQFTK